MAAKKQDHVLEGRWDDVRLFLAAHRHKSLGAAAQRLDLDTSTMSRRLSAFEERLGTRLFERTRDGLQPTRAAELIVAAAEAMEAAHARITRDASDVEAEAEGIVRVSMAPGMADMIAPRFVRLHKQHPKVRIELDASVTARDLTRHEADLALRSLKPHGADLVVTKLGTAGWVAAGSPSLVERIGRLASWNDVPWIAWDRDLASFPPARWLVRYAERAEVLLRTSHFSAQLAAARSGLGVALVPQPYLALHGLAAVRYSPALAASAAALPSDDLWLVGHRALRTIPRIAAVWTFLARELRDLAAKAEDQA